MPPRLGINSQTIMNRLNGGAQPGAAAAPSNSIIDQMLNSYATGAAIPDPVLDGNQADPLQEYLNAGQPPVANPSPSPVSNSGEPNWVKPLSYDQPFTPVGIENSPEWNHNYPVSQVMMNYGKHPLDVVRYWMQNNGERLKNAEPYGANGEYTVSYNYPDLEAYKKDAAKTSQLPPQAYSGEGGGQIGGNNPGGGGGNISQGTYAPPSMPSTPTGSYGDTSGLLSQYARSAPQPASNPAMGNAIQSRLAKMRGGR